MADTPPAEQGTHFWFMTIHTPNARGVYTGSYQGTRNPEPGQTRLDLFNSIRREIAELYPETRGGVALAFDIQPNQL
jgi:hypothetical protein